MTSSTPHLARSPHRRTRRAVVSGATVVALAASGLSLAIAPPAMADAFNPDFGANVTVFSSSDSVSSINTTLRAAADAGTHWSLARKAFFFKPGTYGSAGYTGAGDDPTQIVNSEVGYYTTIAGLGTSPDDVTINGALHVEPEQNNAAEPWNGQAPGSLNNFWRSMSNLAINPIQRPYGADAARAHPEGITNAGQLRWAVSQAAPLRRVHVKGSLTYMGLFGAQASGGFTADTKIDGGVQFGSQQQYYTRDSSIGVPATGKDSVWNEVFSGVTGAPADDFPDSATQTPLTIFNGNKDTTLPTTKASREAPFLTYSASSGYAVFVPKARTNSTGVTWSGAAGTGTSISITDFFIAKPTSSITDINAALAAGKHLLLTPGIYHYSKPIVVTKANTVVLGLGIATLVPDAGNAAIKIGDVAGVKLSGVAVDAGAVTSAVLVKVGSVGGTAGVADNPTTLSDVYFRIGGAWHGSVDTALEVNTNYTILDNIWSWRADHGVDSDVNTGYDWNDNPAKVGVRVNGDNVTATGLFVEHYQENQTVWNGENGTTVFYQSEIPYEPANQADFQDGNRDGYSSYWVNPAVTTHQLYGGGVYSYFRKDTATTTFAANGFSVPKKPGVVLTHLVTRFLNGQGGIRHVVNDYGKEVVSPYTGGDGGVGQEFKENYATTYVRSYTSTTSTDNTAPVLTITASPSAPNSGTTYTTKVDITASATDTVTAPALITLEYRVDDRDWKRVTVNSAGTGIVNPPNGTHTLSFRATDEAGNTSAAKTWSGTVQAAGNPGDLTDPDPGTDPDIGGPGTPGDTSNPGGGGTDPTNPGGGGTDPTNPGNGTDPSNPGQGSNPPGTVTIGTTLTATISVTPTRATGKKGWYKKAVTVAAKGTALAGKQAFVQLKVGTKAWRTYTGPTKVSTNGKAVVLQARIVQSGAASPVDSRTVRIDTKKPTKLKAKTKIKKGKRTIRLTAKDATSKVAKIQYKLKGKGKWKTYKKTKGVKITTKATKIKFRAVDKAGNISKAKTTKIKARR